MTAIITDNYVEIPPSVVGIIVLLVPDFNRVYAIVCHNTCAVVLKTMFLNL